MKKHFGISLSKLLDIDILQNAKLICGKNGLNRKVTKINVMEVPDIIDWVSEGEFILTTAYSIKDNMDKLVNIIERFHKKGVAGLGIKMKRYINVLPKSIIDLSERLEFPIIEIPQDISYSEIMTPALIEIINHQSNMLEVIDKINNKIMNLMVEGGTLKDIGQVLHNSINNTIAIRENIFGDMNVFGCEAKYINHLQEIDYTKEKVRELKEGITVYVQKIVVNGYKLNKLRIPLYAKGVVYGDLLIIEDNKELNSIDYSIIKACTPLMALDIIKKLSVFEIESKHKIEFFDDLLSSDEKKHVKALNKGHIFGYNKHLIYSVICIDLNKKNNMSITPNNVIYLNYINNKVLGIIENLKKNCKDCILYGDKSDKIIILYGSEKKNNLKRKVIKFCNEIVSHGKLEKLHKEFSIGVGRVYDSSADLYKSYRESIKASSKAVDKNVVHYDDLGIYRILSYKEIEGELKDFYMEVLEPLVTYDKEKNSQLVETLQEYFKSRGNLKRMSENMYTHYNTIIYRMQRIKEITEVDFDDYNNVLNMQIALKVYEMNNLLEIS